MARQISRSLPSSRVSWMARTTKPTVITSPWWSVTSHVLHMGLPGFSLIISDNTWVSLGLRSRVGRSSANARPWVASVVGSLPLFSSDSAVSVAMPAVRSHLSGPGIGRSGGSSFSVPLHTCTPCTPPVGHSNGLGADYAVILGREGAQALSGAHGLGDGRLNRHQVGIAPQKHTDRHQVFCLTTLRDHGGLLAQCFHEQPVVGHGGILPVALLPAHSPGRRRDPQIFGAERPFCGCWTATRSCTEPSDKVFFDCARAYGIEHGSGCPTVSLQSPGCSECPPGRVRALVRGSRR